MSMSATYSPEDNKLRLYSTTRLDKELYARVKAAGFKWAPKQDLFVAPTWTPEREDLLIELCSEIDDEDTSLVDRAEVRADRFEEYRESRAKDAQNAYETSSRIAERFAGGQPILVGHHSERRARKDKERIDSAMRQSIKMWDTSNYWKQRAAGALHHAKYKERPDVRARRIKGLEADQRKQQKHFDQSQKFLKAWTECQAMTDKEKQHEEAVMIANYCRVSLPRKEGDKPDFNQRPSVYNALTNTYPTLYAPRTIEEVFSAVLAYYPRSIAYQQRWLNHYENRLTYERAMLDESGGLVADKHELQVGGRVLVRGEWVTILKVNKSGGVVSSVTTNARYCRVRSVEEIKDYQAPSEDQAAQVKAAVKLAPLCNYPGEGFATMTKAQWDKAPKDYKGSVTVQATATAARHRVRHCIGVYACPGDKDMNKRHHYHHVFITDDKRKDAPALDHAAAPVAAVPRPEPDQATRTRPQPVQAADQDESAKFDAMREQLKNGGVKIATVSATPQLFRTPGTQAAEMADLADIRPGDRVLEPSAGTGNILSAIFEAQPSAVIVAVELGVTLADYLRKEFPRVDTRNADFLACTPADLGGLFDCILMNPPFRNADDIKHINHAMKFLKPGGRLVAICAHGPRQVDQLQDLAHQHGGTFEQLPAGTFQDEGTNVNAARLSLALPLPEPELLPGVQDAPETAPELAAAPIPEPLYQRTAAGQQYMLFGF